MKYKLLGNSGLRVSEICLGAMTFGEDWGWGSTEEASGEMYKLFRDAGGNFIDTANVYTNGTSEEITGRLIRGERKNVVLATKYTFSTKPGDPNAGGNHRKNMMQSLDDSLRRLGTDYIDLYWVHVWDEYTPIDEMMRALDDMVRAGKVLYVGISDAPAWVVSRANTIAELRGWTGFAGIQIEYSLVQRGAERDLLPMARYMDVGITAWSPLGSGVLTGKYSSRGAGKKDSKRLEVWKDTFESFAKQYLSEKNLKIADEVVKVAKELDRTPSQVALNWIRQQPGRPIPIIGATKPAHIEDNLKCVEFELSPQHLKRLDEVSAIELGFPQDFINMKEIKHMLYGGTYDMIEKRKSEI
ncbi:MAG TPA: aldo/keto reductase [Thermodesulfobacteriota bacterium]|nr:aldo/keto reductase [Thermodesulfobacteriota bacterium]